MQAAALLAVLLLSPYPSFSQHSPKCSETAKMRVYSNAAFIEEAGDVVGYELVIANKPGTRAWLFVYEGTPNQDGIELTGKATNKKVTFKGIWVEHLVQYPSGKDILQSHPVRFDATFTGKGNLRGRLTIDGNTEAVLLKHNSQIWLCNGETTR